MALLPVVYTYRLTCTQVHTCTCTYPDENTHTLHMHIDTVGAPVYMDGNYFDLFSLQKTWNKCYVTEKNYSTFLN